MTDQFFITRADMEGLQKLLREIPGLVEDLAITLTRQSCIGVGGAQTSSGSDEQPLPYDYGASRAQELLHGEVVGWARHVCEYRRIDYDGGPSTGDVAVWLADRVTSLAMTPGCEEAHASIKARFDAARRSTDLPAEKPPPKPDAAKLKEARALELNARECVQVAKMLGPLHAGLTQRRIKYLTEAGVLVPLRIAKGMDGARHRIYNLGAVLDATAKDGGGERVDERIGA